MVGYGQTKSYRGRMTKWVLEVSEYQVEFQFRRTMQAHPLADFVVENTLLSAIEPETSNQVLDPQSTWVLYVDRSAGQ